MPRSPLPRWNLPVASPPDITWTTLWRHGRGRASYVLPEHWTLHLVQYRAPFTVGDHDTTLRPGQLVLVPPGIRTTTVLETEGNHYFAHFRFDEKASAMTRECPAILDPGPETNRYEGFFSEIVDADPRDPQLARSLLWSLLLRLPALAMPNRHPLYPPVLRMALQQIEERLGDGITVRELTARVEISETHLARLFRKHLAMAPVAWIRRRRMERARYLLTHAPRSITEIAHAVGMRDLQYFNKEIRRSYGVSPRALRRS